MYPPELIELTAPLYAREMQKASEEIENGRFPQTEVWKVPVDYLMKRVSRN
jgi:hypothetical protein